MGDITVHAVVLRYANFSESSRMLTLFSPQIGLVSAAAKGARRLKAALLPMSEVFVFGTYTLHRGRSGGLSVVSAALIDSFYALREDLDRLSAASAMAQMVLALAPEGDPAPELFTLLIRSLESLCHDGEEPLKTALHFEMNALSLAGYAPHFSDCALCGKPLGKTPGFSPSDGGAVCGECAARAGLPPVLPGTLKTLEHLMSFDAGRLHVLVLSDQAKQQAQELWSRYRDAYLGRHLRAPEFAQRVRRFQLGCGSGEKAGS